MPINKKHAVVLGAIGIKFSPKLAKMLNPLNHPIKLNNGKNTAPIMINDAMVLGVIVVDWVGGSEFMVFKHYLFLLLI